MKTKDLTRFVFISIVSLFFFVAAGSSNLFAQIRLATYRYGDNDRLKNLALLADALSEKLHTITVVRSYDDVFKLVDAVKNGDADIALISTLGYLYLDQVDVSRTMRPAVTWHTSAEQGEQYRCVLISQAHSRISDIKEIAEQAGKLRMLFVAPGSTSGNLMPRLFLNTIGISAPETQFSSVRYGGTHYGTAELLSKDSADVAALGSTSYQHFIRENPGKVNLLWISPAIPLGPVLVSKKLSSETRKKITDVFIHLHNAFPKAFASLKDGWSEARQSGFFVPAEPKLYDEIAQQFRTKEILRNLLEN